MDPEFCLEESVSLDWYFADMAYYLADSKRFFLEALHNFFKKLINQNFLPKTLNQRNIHLRILLFLPIRQLITCIHF